MSLRSFASLRQLRSALLPLVALLLGLAACAGDPGSGSITDDSRTRPDAGDTGTTDTFTPPTGQTRLELVSSQDVYMPFAGTAELTVRYVDFNDQPIADATLNFDIDEAFAADTRLRTQTTRTDAEGIASVGVVAGAIPAEFEVTVTVRGNDVLPAVFQITVRPKDISDYFIQIVNASPLRLQKAETFVFNEAITCAELPTDPNLIVGALQSFDIYPDASGIFDQYPLEVDLLDMPLRTIVAIGYKEDQPVAVGCVDTLPVDLEPGSAITVEVVLNPLYPSVAGVYRVTNEFDVFEFLPPGVQTIVRTVGDFLTDPGQTLLDLLATPPTCDPLGCPLAGLPSFVTASLPGVINGLIEAFAPAQVQQIFSVGGDIYATLSHFKLAGDLSIFDEPDVSGRLGTCNEMVLNEIIVTFDSFETPPFNLESYGYQAAYGTWTGSVQASESAGVGYYLNVESFGLTLNYGQIIVFILEQVVFPEVLGPDIRSLEDFVASVINCNQIAIDVGWAPIEGICDGFRDALAAFVRDFLISQTASLDSLFQLATPVEGTAQPADVELLSGVTWGPCQLQLSDRDFTAESIGGTGADRCVWDSRFGAGTTPQAVPGAFYGTRISQTARGICGDGQ